MMLSPGGNTKTINERIQFEFRLKKKGNLDLIKYKFSFSLNQINFGVKKNLKKTKQRIVGRDVFCVSFSHV